MPIPRRSAGRSGSGAGTGRMRRRRRGRRRRDGPLLASWASAPAFTKHAGSRHLGPQRRLGGHRSCSHPHTSRCMADPFAGPSIRSRMTEPEGRGAGARSAGSPSRPRGRLLTYGSYLKVPQRLALQQVQSDPPCTTSCCSSWCTTYEFWFSQLLFELEATRRDVRGPPEQARHLTSLRCTPSSGC